MNVGEAIRFRETLNTNFDNAQIAFDTDEAQIVNIDSGIDYLNDRITELDNDLAAVAKTGSAADIEPTTDKQFCSQAEKDSWNDRLFIREVSTGNYEILQGSVDVTNQFRYVIDAKLYGIPIVNVDELPTPSEETMSKLYVVLNQQTGLYNLYTTVKDDSTTPATYSFNLSGENIPMGNFIPTKTSQLANDSGFVTQDSYSSPNIKILENVTFSNFAQDSTYIAQDPNLKYRASHTDATITEDMFPQGNLSHADYIAGRYVPLIETYNGGVYVWSDSNANVTFENIVLSLPSTL